MAAASGPGSKGPNSGPSGAKDITTSRNNQLILEKFYRLAHEEAAAIIRRPENVRCEFELQVSQDEYNIISSDANVLLWGRSGTGKTTCMLLFLGESVCCLMMVGGRWWWWWSGAVLRL